MGTVLKGILGVGQNARVGLQGEYTKNPQMRTQGNDREAPVPTPHNITRTIIPGLEPIAPRHTTQFTATPSPTIHHTTPWFQQLLKPPPPLPRAPLFDDEEDKKIPELLTSDEESDDEFTPPHNHEDLPSHTGACASGSSGQADAHLLSGKLPTPAGACASDPPSQVLDGLLELEGDFPLGRLPSTSSKPDNTHLTGSKEALEESSGDEYLTWWPLPDGTTPQQTTPTIIYHTRAHLPDDSQEALLADTGAYDGIAGEHWVTRQATLAQAAGLQPVYTQLDKVLRVQGVGKEAQEVDYKVSMPGRLESGDDIMYEVPVIPGSHVPALAGMKTFERLNGTLDCRTTERKLYIGNDYTITPGPNTQVIQMYPAISGHLMIPISRFDLKPRHKQTTMPFIAEEAPQASTATSSTDPAPPMQQQGHRPTHSNSTMQYQ